MSIHRNHNYSIGTDTLTDGRIRAKARGRKTTQRTFPAGTSHDDAAAELARIIEGERFARVEIRTSLRGIKADWAVYVQTSTAATRAIFA